MCNKHGLGEKRMEVGRKRELRPLSIDKERSLQPEQDSIVLRSMEHMLCSAPTFEKHAPYWGNAAQPRETEQDKCQSSEFMPTERQVRPVQGEREPGGQAVRKTS